MEYRSKIISHFEMNGFRLKSSATDKICRILKRQNSEDGLETLLNKITDLLQEKDLHSTQISREQLDELLQESSDLNDQVEFLFVYDAFDFPKYSYSVDQKKFIPVKLSPTLHPEAISKISLFRDRFLLIWQILQRHELFTVRSIASSVTSKYKLTSIESLLSSYQTSGQSLIVLGMLVQLKEGVYYLEDLSATVILDVSCATFQKGIFCENSIILVEGFYKDKTLYAQGIGFPPPETAETTISIFGHVNFFGGTSKVCPKASNSLQELESSLGNSFLVILSDVWLDKLDVLHKLKTLFEGYSADPPVCFIFIGNFSSTPYGSLHFKRTKQHFKELASLITDYPSIASQSYFVFVPGPEDIGPGNILPRPPLPNHIQEIFKKHIPRAIFTSNPTRIQFCTKEIVIFRENLLKKMCTNAVRFTSRDNVPDHLAHTVLSQASLCPLPLHTCPVYWDFNHALNLYPLPDIVILADNYLNYSVNTYGVNCINPGPFVQNEYSFMAVYPATMRVEDCKLP